MKRDDCLCLNCLSTMSQFENRKILVTRCQCCGKELIARAKPGYQYCAKCSTLKRCCMGCGKDLSTPSEQLAIQLIRKFLEIEPTLRWSYEVAASILMIEMGQFIGRMYPQKIDNEESAAVQLQLIFKDVATQMNLSIYQEKIINSVEEDLDIKFLMTHLNEIQSLVEKGCVYQSDYCGRVIKITPENPVVSQNS